MSVKVKYPKGQFVEISLDPAASVWHRGTVDDHYVEHGEVFYYVELSSGLHVVSVPDILIRPATSASWSMNFNVSITDGRIPDLTMDVFYDKLQELAAEFGFKLDGAIEPNFD